MAIIEVQQLEKRYGSRTALDGVSFSVDEGEIFGILGPNGAGKTTLVECIEGLRAPDAGAVRVCGLDPQRDHRELSQLLGAQLQESELPAKITVREAMQLYSSFYRSPVDWRELIDVLHMNDKLGAQFRHLSGGQKQRLSIALAMVGGPKVVVLDELTTGLDPQARRDVWGLVEDIRDRGVTIVLVTHFMEEAERLGDRLAVIDDGRLVALDTPAGLIAKMDNQHRVRLRPTEPFDHALLAALPQVTSVERAGNQIIVTGSSDLLPAVTAAMAAHGLVATELRAEPITLDDAFVSLTGRRPIES